MTMNLEYVDCALCDSDDTELFFEDGPFHLVRCKRCGVVYLNPRPTLEEIECMYNAPVQIDKRVMDYRGYIDLAYLHVLKASKFLKIISKYQKTGRILDIGCAAGFFLKLAKEKGYNPYGVEISEMFCNFAKKEFGLDVFCGILKEANYPSEYFDVVTMFDVLSHLPRPVQYLQEVNRILRKEGLFLIETGNKGELNAKAIEKWGITFGSPSHLYHYSAKTLMKLFEKTEFDCLEMSKSSVVFSSMMESVLSRIIRSRKSKTFSYQEIRIEGMPMLLKQYFMKAGVHVYLLAKYTLGKFFQKSNTDSTMLIICSKKTSNK